MKICHHHSNFQKELPFYSDPANYRHIALTSTVRAVKSLKVLLLLILSNYLFIYFNHSLLSKQSV